MMNYTDFIDEKQKIIETAGIDLSPEDLNPKLYPFQKDIVRWALAKGKAAIFADCGLGKTAMQLEWAHQICRHTGGNVLVLAPLAVSQQTVMEGAKFDIPVHLCESQADVKPGINITNYEKLSKFEAHTFAGIVLDESSILKSFTGKIRNEIIESFEKVLFKLACTATPAPNDYMELGNHSEFLGVMSRSEMLSMFFIHDGSDTSKWRLKGHAEDVFWQWMCSWSVFIDCPSNLGYEMDGYDLPELHIHEIIADGEEYDLTPLTLTGRRKARKDTLQERTDAAAELVSGSSDQWLIWCDLNDESKMLAEKIAGSVEVKGSDKAAHKTASMMGFSAGDVRHLVTKPSIAGFGMNWQNCHNMIFVGLSDSYEKLYQAIRRCWRFGQEHPVHVYIIISKKEGCVKQNIERKEQDAMKMREMMSTYTKEITKKELQRTHRMGTPYTPQMAMVLPGWEEFACAS